MDAARITALSLWVGAWLRGAEGTDDLLVELARATPDAPATVSLDGSPAQPLSALLAALRALPGERVWVLLPRPGATVGWPPDAPGDPGPGVLVTGPGPAGVTAGLLRPSRAGWCWDSCSAQSLPALEAGMLTAHGGARALGELASDAAGRLEALGLDRPPVGALPEDWARAMRHLPVGVPAPVQALLIRIAALHDALDLALVEEGAAVTAAESRSRSAELRSVLGAVEDLAVGLVAGMNLVDTDPAGRGVAWAG